MPDCRPSPMQGREVMPFFNERGGRLHIHDLGRARIADRARAAHEQQSVFVDLQGRIVDAMVIILGTFENHGAALECILVFGVGEITLAEFIRNHAGLHDRGIKQVSLQDLEARLLFHRRVVRLDDVCIRAWAHA